MTPREVINRTLVVNVDPGLGATVSITNDAQVTSNEVATEVAMVVTPVPEPGVILQLISGVLGLAFLDRQRRRRDLS
jgi:hypothetical protein